MCTERHQNTSLPNTSKISHSGGSTVELLLPEHCCCYGGKLGCLWRPFWLFSTYKKQDRSKKYFFRKKKGIWGHNRGPPYAHFFYTKNLFSAQLDFPPSTTAKKAPKLTWACFHCCSSALATLIQLSTRAWDPERDGANRPPTLVPFSAHSPPTRRRSGFMPRGTTPAHPTTNAAVIPARWPLPSIEPGRARMGNTVPVSFSVVAGEPSD